MTIANDNENCTYGIEKFEGTFEKEEIGVTIVPTQTLNQIRNADALGVYMYLLGRPSGWKPNVKHLKAHFNCTKEKIYSCISYLLTEGFMTKTAIRFKGKFVNHHYKVHLHRLMASTMESTDDLVDRPEETQAQPDFSPLPGKPETGKPDTGNPDAYKTYTVENIEGNKKPFVDSPKSTEVHQDYSEDGYFMKFYEIYPNKQKPRVAHIAFYKAARRARMDVEAFSQMVYEDVLVRLKNNWAGRPKNKYPFPQKYLNDAEWQGEINTPDVKEVKPNGQANGASDTTSYW